MAMKVKKRKKEWVVYAYYYKGKPVYVGCTGCMYDRNIKHKNYGKKRYDSTTKWRIFLKNYLEEHNDEMPEYRILWVCKDEQHALNLERMQEIDFLAKEFDLLNERTCGANKGSRHSEASKKRMSENQKGHVVSQETKIKISKSLKGRARCKEAVDKTAKCLSRPVLKISLDGEVLKKLPSTREASNEVGLHRSGIIKVCRKQQKTAGGFKWAYA